MLEVLDFFYISFHITPFSIFVNLLISLLVCLDKTEQNPIVVILAKTTGGANPIDAYTYT